MSFQTNQKDDSPCVLKLIGANNDKDSVAKILFRNYDNDSQAKYDMASIDVLNALDGTSDGYGQMNFNTYASGTLNQIMTLTHTGRVGIGLETPSELLDVAGNVKVQGSLSIGGTLYGDNISQGGDGPLVTTSTLSVAGASTLGSSLDVSGNTLIQGTLDVTQNTRIGGSLSVANLYGTVVPDGDLVSDFNLSVGANSELTNNVRIGGTLSVAGNVYGGSALDVSGSTVLGQTLSVAGNVYGGSALDVSGSTVLGQTLSVAGNVYGGSALDVCGNSRIGGWLSVAGEIYGQSGVMLVGDLDINGNARLSGMLSVGGEIDLSGNFHLNGDTTLSGTLSVGKEIDLSGNLYTSGEVVIDNLLSVANNVDICGNLVVTGEIRFDNTNVTLSSDGNIYRDGVTTILDRIYYIKQGSDFGDPSGNKIYLQPNRSYQMDGIVQVSYTLVTAPGTTFFGAGYEDGLFFTMDTSGNECCIEVTDVDFVAFFLSMQAPYAPLFKATNLIYNQTVATANLSKRFQLFSTRMTNILKLGTIDGFGTININNNLISYCGGSFEISNGRSLEFINNKVVLWMLNGPYSEVNTAAATATMVELISNDRDASNLGYGFQVISIVGNIFHPRNFGGENLQTALKIHDGHTTVLGLIGTNTFIVENYAKQIAFDGSSSFNDFVTYEVVGNSGVEDQKPQIEMKESGINTTLGLTYQYSVINSLAIVDKKRFVVVDGVYDAVGNGFIEYQDAKPRRLLFWVNLEIRVTGGNPNTRFNLNAYLESEYGYTGPSDPSANQVDYGALTDLSFQSIGKSSIQGNVLYSSLIFSTIVVAEQYTRYRFLFNNQDGDVGLNTDYNYHVIISSL